MTLEGIKPLLVKYVDRNSNIYNIEWDPEISEKLLIDPFDKSKKGSRENAHYFLLAAAITETQLIGRAENSRALIIHFHKRMKDGLFEAQDEGCFKEHIKEFPFYEELGPDKDTIPHVLASANRFVHEIAEGDLPQYAEKFAEPTEMVEEIGKHIERMGGPYIEKSWMYVRWMTRTHPDLGIFHFSTAELQIPLTSYIRDVGFCLCLCFKPDSERWQDLEYRIQAREAITSFARDLFPEDPSKVDYPFYLLGRWIRGKQLNLQLLSNYLKFFDDLYSKTHSAPVHYDIVSRNMSNFEERVRAELQKMKLLFYFESHRFNLPRGITYLPDFVLPEIKVKGKTVLLEPHGIWSYPQTRITRIGGKTMKIRAYGTEKDQTESQFAEKLRRFRETYGQDYHLILIVPARVKERVERWYPGSFDEIHEGADIPELLYKFSRMAH